MDYLECPDCGIRVYEGIEEYEKHICLNKLTHEQYYELIKVQV